MPLRCVEELIERRDVRCKQMRGRLYAALRMREKRPFEMNGDGVCASGDRWFFDAPCQSCYGFQGGVQRRGYGGREETAGSTGSQKRADCFEGDWCRFHYVMPGGAVKVHVEKRRSQQCAGKIQDLRALWQGC